MNESQRSKLREVLTLAEDNLRCLSQRATGMHRRSSNLHKMEGILEELELADMSVSQLYKILDDAI